MIGWLSTFLLTLAVELVVAFPLLSLIEPRWRMRVRLVVIGNVLTHPIVFFVALAAASRPFFPLVVLGLELLAGAAESLVYARAFGRRPWLPAVFTSYFANAASLTASLCIAAWR